MSMCSSMISLFNQTQTLLQVQERTTTKTELRSLALGCPGDETSLKARIWRNAWPWVSCLHPQKRKRYSIPGRYDRVRKQKGNGVLLESLEAAEMLEARPREEAILEIQDIQEGSEQKACAFFLRQSKVQKPASSVSICRRAFKWYVNTCTLESSRISRILCEPHLNTNISREACRMVDAIQQLSSKLRTRIDSFVS